LPLILADLVQVHLLHGRKKGRGRRPRPFQKISG
jgi:hypothetical protein